MIIINAHMIIDQAVTCLKVYVTMWLDRAAALSRAKGFSCQENFMTL